MKRALVMFAAAISLGGCGLKMTVVPYHEPSLATPYQPMTVWTLRGGYKDKKLAEDRYQVEFAGNGEVSNTAAEDFATMRGAELCQAAGYAYFKMIQGTITSIRTYTNGIPSVTPDAKAEIQCGHDAGTGWRPAADTIAQTEINYPLMYPKGKKK